MFESKSRKGEKSFLSRRSSRTGLKSVDFNNISHSFRRERIKMSLFIFTLISAFVSTAVQGANNVINIHWNSSNPLFRVDKTDNMIDINSDVHNGVTLGYDQVNIVCPVYKAGTDSALQENYIIYSVTKDEYESCRIKEKNPKIVALCNRPYQVMYFTITFRSFTPTPGGLEFAPGQDYYFISTSSKGDLHRRVGGGCSSHNMKVVFRVAPRDKTEVEEINNEVTTPHSTTQTKFPWSHERDFRRTFSATSATYYSYPSNEMELQRQEERRPKHSVEYNAIKREAIADSSSGTSASTSGLLLGLTLIAHFWSRWCLLAPFCHCVHRKVLW